MKTVKWIGDVCCVVPTSYGGYIGRVFDEFGGYGVMFSVRINLMGTKDVHNFPSKAAAREHIEAVARTLIVGGLI